MKRSEVSQADKDMKDISAAITDAEQYGLQLEVLWSALKYAKDQPNWSTRQIMSAACGDWDVNP